MAIAPEVPRFAFPSAPLLLAASHRTTLPACCQCRRAIAPELPHFSPRDLAQTVWALQRLRHLPSTEWMLRFHALLRARLQHFSPLSLVVLLCALGGYAPVYQVRGGRG